VIAMVKGISLKLDETLYTSTQRLLKELRLSRNAYIKQAVAHYNQLHERRLLAQRLREESRLVQAESQAVLSEFERLPERLP
jgi:hypothetical protein